MRAHYFDYFSFFWFYWESFYNKTDGKHNLCKCDSAFEITLIHILDRSTRGRKSVATSIPLRLLFPADHAADRIRRHYWLFNLSLSEKPTAVFKDSHADDLWYAAEKCGCDDVSTEEFVARRFASACLCVGNKKLWKSLTDSICVIRRIRARSLKNCRWRKLRPLRNRRSDPREKSIPAPNVWSIVSHVHPLIY